MADDVILTNVIGFDVKAWDPYAPVRQFADPVTSQPVIVRPGDSRYLQAVALNAEFVSYCAYVDLGWVRFDPTYPATSPNLPPGTAIPKVNLPMPAFGYYGSLKSALAGNAVSPPNISSPCVYDSYSFSYENRAFTISTIPALRSRFRLANTRRYRGKSS